MTIPDTTPVAVLFGWSSQQRGKTRKVHIVRELTHWHDHTSAWWFCGNVTSFNPIITTDASEAPEGFEPCWRCQDVSSRMQTPTEVVRHL